MYRRRGAAGSSAPHPTYSRILDSAIVVLGQDGFDRFTIQRVLEVAEVSRATLYNHFGDVDSLIEAALIHTFSQELDDSRMALLRLVEEAVDYAAFRVALRAYVQTVAEIPSDVRMRRTHTLSLTAGRPALAVAIRVVQDEITAAWEETIQFIIDRGFARPGLDPRATAVILQALPLGYIVDDVSGDHIGTDRWADSYFELVSRAMLAPVD